MNTTIPNIQSPQENTLTLSLINAIISFITHKLFNLLNNLYVLYFLCDILNFYTLLPLIILYII